jgi:hypothetical protein
VVPYRYYGPGYRGVGYYGVWYLGQDLGEEEPEPEGRSGESWGAQPGETSWRRGAGQGHAGRGPKGYQRSDDRIKEDVNDRLTENDRLDASEMEVAVKSGEVTLKGTVPNRQSKRLAEDIAESVAGVHDVMNQLRVVDDRKRVGEHNGGSGATKAGRQSPTSGRTPTTARTRSGAAMGGTSGDVSGDPYGQGQSTGSTR